MVKNGLVVFSSFSIVFGFCVIKYSVDSCVIQANMHHSFVYLTCLYFCLLTLLVSMFPLSYSLTMKEIETRSRQGSYSDSNVHKQYKAKFLFLIFLILGSLIATFYWSTYLTS